MDQEETMADVLMESHLDDVRFLRRGKVRDIYEIGDYLLILASDRVSAFDVVLPNGIPGKGEVLTKISLFWFRQVEGIIGNHIVATDVDDYPAILHKYRIELAGRSMLVKKAETIPVECIVRGYLSGSGWQDYRKTGMVCGIKLPEGLVESSRLDTPIFTPSTKAEEGHDINISFNALIDELLTPDSSRFWSIRDYQPGKGQDSYDKQIVRDYLLTLDWDKTYPGPVLPEEIIGKTAARYREILEILTA